MTPREHFSEAERIIRAVDTLMSEAATEKQAQAVLGTVGALYARAQVHATLATVPQEAVVNVPTFGGR